MLGGSSPVGPFMELYIDESWVDVSSYVRYENKIKLTGGRPDEAGKLQRGTCKFTLNNRDGLFSPRNPRSPYYRKIGRNTLCRTGVTYAGTRRYRFYGEISSWPAEWDVSGRDVWVPIEASGIMRRLSQGNSPLRSTLYRGLTREKSNPVKAYWPMEDGENASFLASAVANSFNMTYTGTPTLASYDGFNCSSPIPVMGTATFTAKVKPYVVTNETQIRFLMAIPTAGETTGEVVCRINTTGSAARWDLVYDTSGTSSFRLLAYDSNGVLLQDSGVLNFLTVDGALTRVSVEMTQSGSNVNNTVSVLYEDVGLVNDTTTFLAMTMGRVTSIQFAPGGGLTETAIGHLSLQVDTTSSFDLFDQFHAYDGENPSNRLTRLCVEEGIPFQVVSLGQGGNIVSMGPQGIKTLVDLLHECVDVDMGMLYEPRDAFGLEYRTRLSLHNQDPHITLSYSASDLFTIPVPVDDDQLATNDVTVTRNKGASARAVQETGPLSILPPPAGIGLYDSADTFSLEDDEQLASQASWRLHLGTVDEPRYPSISVHLMRPTFVASYALATAALTLGLGDRILVTDSPAHLPPDDISQLAQGFAETYDQFEHVIDFNCAPESPWRIGYLDDDVLGRADTTGSELTSAVAADALTFRVTTTGGPVWVQDVAEFPFDVMIGGEVMTVTGISGTTSPQTFTVTRSTNTIVKAHTAGTDVALLQPMIIPL